MCAIVLFNFYTWQR